MNLLPLLLLVLCLGVGTLAAAADEPSLAETQMQNLGFLSGHWRNAEFEAIYTSPEGGMILSVSKWYDHGAASFGEFERISIVEGVVALTPYPGGTQSAHDFPLIHLSAANKRVEFQNLEHDWPTHFTYECPDPDTLHILVSGPGGDGKPKELEFTLQRVVD